MKAYKSEGPGFKYDFGWFLEIRCLLCPIPTYCYVHAYDLLHLKFEIAHCYWILDFSLKDIGGIRMFDLLFQPSDIKIYTYGIPIRVYERFK